MEPIKFDDFRVQIITAIDERLKKNPIEGESGFTLVEGIIMEQLNKEFSTNIVIGGPTTLLPLVSIVGNTTGRVYYFAVKTLNIPGLKI